MKKNTKIILLLVVAVGLSVIMSAYKNPARPSAVTLGGELYRFKGVVTEVGDYHFTMIGSPEGVYQIGEEKPGNDSVAVTFTSLTRFTKTKGPPFPKSAASLTTGDFESEIPNMNEFKADVAGKGVVVTVSSDADVRGKEVIEAREVNYVVTENN